MATADRNVLLIPYRGVGPAMTDLISGQVDLLLVQGAVALPQMRAGTIKALAELSPQRRLPQDRARQMVADHPGGGDQRGVILSGSCYIFFPWGTEGL